ncbi:YitT family protein [Aceticella autotrophica]|uniref:YitT family protein n=1 Tax=Aceticella autotrophica TaxID=2755338 RepID=A0A975AWB3_9THEO|nr:YitT family protein [Aceticella autotrophica]QSZ27647.1 YitT family protein [Aceticella autotrophica]
MNTKVKKIIYDFVWITIGTLLLTLSLDLFLAPNRIAPGGISGLAIVLQHLFGWPVGAVILLINIPLFIISIKILGTGFGAKTLYSTMLLGVSVDVFSFLKPLTHDPMLAAVYGGIIMGLGLGIVFKYGATTGGTDMAAMTIHKYVPFLSVGRILLIIDFIIIVLAGIVFTPELALYALATEFLGIKVIDIVQEGTDYERIAIIISDKYEDISKSILYDMNRGVTELKGVGAYSKKDKNVLLCVVTRNEVTNLRELVKKADPAAFVILTTAHEVMGEGFRDI